MLEAGQQYPVFLLLLVEAGGISYLVGVMALLLKAFWLGYRHHRIGLRGQVLAGDHGFPEHDLPVIGAHKKCCGELTARLELGPGGIYPVPAHFGTPVTSGLMYCSAKRPDRESPSPACPAKWFPVPLLISCKNEYRNAVMIYGIGVAVRHPAERDSDRGRKARSLLRQVQLKFLLVGGKALQCRGAHNNAQLHPAVLIRMGNKAPGFTVPDIHRVAVEYSCSGFSSLSSSLWQAVIRPNVASPAINGVILIFLHLTVIK